MASPRMKIGQFYQHEDGSLVGKISALGLGSIEVATMDAVTFEKIPYLKFIADPEGEAYEIGAAFPRTQSNGQIYYSVSIDSPLFAAPMSGALLPDRDDAHTFNMLWTRPEMPKHAVNAKADNELNQPQSSAQEEKQQAKSETKATGQKETQSQKRGWGRRSSNMTPH